MKLTLFRVDFNFGKPNCFLFMNGINVSVKAAIAKRRPADMRQGHDDRYLKMTSSSAGIRRWFSDEWIGLLMTSVPPVLPPIDRHRNSSSLNYIDVVACVYGLANGVLKEYYARASSRELSSEICKSGYHMRKIYGCFFRVYLTN